MSQKFLHHLGTGAGFAGLIGWFYAGRELGIMEWAAQQVPVEYGGAGLMVGIILVMTPGFFLWKLYNRWMEKKLAITGMYYEDAYYAEMDKQKAGRAKNEKRQSANRTGAEGRENDRDNDNDGNDGGGGDGGGDGGD